MKNNNLTYEKSGVNIKAADNFVKYISSLSKKRQNRRNFQNIGLKNMIGKKQKQI